MSELSLEQEIFDMIVKGMEMEEEIKEMPEDKLAFDRPLFQSMDPDGLALDSLEALELVVLLKDSYGITVQDEDIHKLTSVSKIADFVRNSQV